MSLARARRGELGHRREDPFTHLGGGSHRDEVGLGEVAVVVGLLLRAHRVRTAVVLVPVPRLLHDALAALEDRDLPAGLVVDRPPQGTDRVEVLDLGPRSELLDARPAHRHVRVDTQRALLHLHVGDPDRQQRRAQLVHVLAGLVGAAQVGLGDDLEEGHAGAVVVDERVRGVVDASAPAHVHGLAGVLFEVRAHDPHTLAVDVEVPGDTDRLVVLRRLVVLWHVGVEVVLPMEHRLRRHAEVECLTDPQRELDGLLVEHGQRARKAQAHGADERVRICSERVGAAAEELRRGGELDVHLEADHDLPPVVRAPGSHSALPASSTTRAALNSTGSPSAGASS